MGGLLPMRMQFLSCLFFGPLSCRNTCNNALFCLGSFVFSPLLFLANMFRLLYVIHFFNCRSELVLVTKFPFSLLTA